MGMRTSPSGTGPAVPYRATFSITTQGSSSKMHELRSPLASAGVDGTTTLSPGMWASQPSSVWEWVAPDPIPPNTAVLTVRGTDSRPPDMNRALAA